MIKLIIDSTCDIPNEKLKEFDITILPITVDIEGVSYKDKVNLNSEDFYIKIRGENVFPKTAQINPSTFEEAFQNEIDNNNEVICLTISSTLSGTFNSAMIAKNTIDSSKIHVIDSKTVSYGTGLIAIEAAKLIKKGASINEVLDKINHIIENQDVIAYLDTMEMLKRGGRIPKSIATIGNVLRIKPLLSMIDGELKPIEKAKGKKNALKLISKYISKNPIDENIGLYIAHSNITSGIASEIEFLEKYNIKYNVEESVIGASVGTHVGENAIAIFFVRK